ncbi:MAG: DUF84 family protein, partial [Thermoplasmata archaeon]
RIISGEISRSGRRLRPINIAISTHNEAKVYVLGKYIRSFMKNFSILKNEDYSLPTEQPFGSDTLKLAIKRSMDALKNNDYAVGVESGLMYSRDNDQFMDVHFCAVTDRNGRITTGSSSGFEVPDDIIDLIKRSMTFSEAYSKFIDTRNIDERRGIIGEISANRLRREDLIMESIRNAFIQRFNPTFYEKDRNPYRE